MLRCVLCFSRWHNRINQNRERSVGARCSLSIQTRLWSSCADSAPPPFRLLSIFSVQQCCHLLQQLFFFFHPDLRKNVLLTCDLRKWNKVFFNTSVSAIDRSIRTFFLPGIVSALSYCMPRVCLFPVSVMLVSIAMTPMLPHSLLPGRHCRGDSVLLKNFSSLQLLCKTKERYSSSMSIVLECAPINFHWYLVGRLRH